MDAEVTKPNIPSVPMKRRLRSKPVDENCAGLVFNVRPSGITASMPNSCAPMEPYFAPK
jgi:hypothetical protein